MTWGDITKIFNANNVKFQMEDSDDALQEIILMNTFKMVKDVPIDRTISRAGPVELPSFVLREFHITADMSKELYNRLEAISEPTARGGFNTVPFRMEAENIIQASDDIALNFDGFVRHFEDDAVADQKFKATFIIRAIHNSEVISRPVDTTGGAGAAAGATDVSKKSSG